MSEAVSRPSSGDTDPCWQPHHDKCRTTKRCRTLHSSTNNYDSHLQGIGDQASIILLWPLLYCKTYLICCVNSCNYYTIKRSGDLVGPRENQVRNQQIEIRMWILDLHLLVTIASRIIVSCASYLRTLSLGHHPQPRSSQ